MYYTLGFNLILEDFAGHYLNNRTTFADVEAKAYYEDLIDSRPMKNWSDGLYIVKKGFHSYLNIDRVPTMGLGYFLIMHCTIPKNSQVIYDETGMIVSNRIIIETVVKT